MELSKTGKTPTLVRRELQEYRTSLLITPVAVGGLLLFLMLMSVLLAGRITIIGDSVRHILSSEGTGAGVSITIDVDDAGKAAIVREEMTEEEPGQLELVEPQSPEAEPQKFVIVEESEADSEDDWNFSKEWTFSPPHRERVRSHEHEIDTLNPVLNGVNMLFLFIMLIVTINYLLGCLYQDRKDKSILFWKSMPVSEWQEVASKMAVASLVVPAVFLVVSIVTQLLSILLAMLMVWRMGGSATETVLSNIQFMPLIANQVGGLLVWILWTAPSYAWFMLASAAARRSPFMLAFAIPIGLVFIESMFMGTNYVLSVIANHLPHMIDGDDAQSMGMYVHGPVWGSLDYLGMLMGLVFAAAAISGAVWLRRHRFEI